MKLKLEDIKKLNSEEELVKYLESQKIKVISNDDYTKLENDLKTSTEELSKNKSQFDELNKKFEDSHKTVEIKNGIIKEFEKMFNNGTPVKKDDVKTANIEDTIEELLKKKENK